MASDDGVGVYGSQTKGLTLKRSLLFGNANFVTKFIRPGNDRAQFFFLFGEVNIEQQCMAVKV